MSRRTRLLTRSHTTAPRSGLGTSSEVGPHAPPSGTQHTTVARDSSLYKGVQAFLLRPMTGFGGPEEKTLSFLSRPVLFVRVRFKPGLTPRKCLKPAYVCTVLVEAITRTPPTFTWRFSAKLFLAS